MSDRLNFAILLLTIPFSFAMGLVAGGSIVSFEHSEAWRKFSEKDCYPFALAYANARDFDKVCAGP